MEIENEEPEVKKEPHKALVYGDAAYCVDTKASAAGFTHGEREAIEKLDKVCGVEHKAKRGKFPHDKSSKASK